ncbi:peptidoglycan-binding protein [Frankia sp. R82]|uniref:peptidoglycan-binding protein n=1 Tax=Frankia sp. R82 TaxID=2950553 RepID=UPI002043B441|nr:peptidoglycan-binding protein [Frankia sp. R82]MCM3883951.1 peptidoglycan-binding protein [Frankia sp. R82]
MPDPETADAPAVSAATAAGFAATAPVLAQIAFELPPDADAASFPAAARAVLDAFGQCAGFRGGRLARALDAPRTWLLTTEWDGPGPWRRALSVFEVRCTLTPLLVHAVDAPGSYEVLATVGTGAGTSRTYRSDRAPDADVAAPGLGRDR